MERKTYFISSLLVFMLFFTLTSIKTYAAESDKLTLVEPLNVESVSEEDGKVLWSGKPNIETTQSNTPTLWDDISMAAATSVTIRISCTRLHNHHATIASNNNIYPGEKSNRVKVLQALLIGNGYNIGSSGMDSSYGPATQEAIRRIQQFYGAKVDGIIGTGTADILKRKLMPLNNPCPGVNMS